MQTTLTPKTAENLTTLLMRSNYDDLSPETLLAAFQAEGVRSLEDLTQRMTQELQRSDARPQPIPYESLFTTPTPREIVERIEHSVPEVPIVVDGVTYDPQDITRFNGQEIGYIPQNGGSSLLLLTDRSVWAPFVRSAMLARSLASAVERYEYGGFQWNSPPENAQPATFDGPVIIIPPPTEQPIPYWIAYLEHDDLNGDGLWVYSGESRRDLRYVGSWPFQSDWNDQFSSYTRTRGLSMAYEHIHFTGSWIWTGPSSSHTLSLRSFGWNDRISSVINSG